MSDTFVIHTDGGSRGNPGPAAFAYVIERPGEPDIEAKGFLGITTNNIAEYTALVKALEEARTLGGKRLVINSDSELLVQQMKGKYKVRHEGLIPLYQEAKGLCDDFDDVQFRHIYREHNKRADRLCNEALDDPERSVTPAKVAAPAKVPAPALASKRNDLRERGVALLRSAAQAWADDEDDAPSPEKVWDQLWTMIEAERRA